MARTSTGDLVSVRLITLTIVGFIFGALAAGGIGVSVIREVRTLDEATSLPAQNIAHADGYHIDPSETLISSVALVPDRVTVGDAGLVISYDLVSVAPSLGVAPADTGPLLYPRRWLVEALGGEFEAVLASPADATAVFPLLAGGTLEQIDTVRVVEAYIPAPFEVPVSLSGDQPKVTVMPGVDIELVGAVNDRDTTTIEVRVLVDESAARDVLVVGDGPDWHAAVAGGSSVTLTRSASDESADFDIIVFGTSWVAVDGDFVVNIGAAGE